MSTHARQIPSPVSKIVSGADYIESLRNRGLEVWLFGQKVDTTTRCNK